MDNHVRWETIFEILDKLAFDLVTNRFQDEKVDINVVISASDEDLIRLGVGTIGNRIKLRDACRRFHKANSSLRSLEMSQEISTNRLGFEERSLLFSPSFGRNNESRQKKRRSRDSGAGLLVVVTEGQQIGHSMVSLCVFRTSMPKKYPLRLKK